MKKAIWKKSGEFLGDMRLTSKIRFLLILIMVPLFCVFVFQYVSMYNYSQQYDRIIANASKAGNFSISFKEEYDKKIYLLIVGNSSFEKENPYAEIDSARAIIRDLMKNTTMEDNKHRAQVILNLLDNLEKCTRIIQNNQIRINQELGAIELYDETISIWENDVQSVTGLIQFTVLEYSYYETKDMENLRQAMSASLGVNFVISMTVFVVLVGFALILSVVIPNSIAKPIYQLSTVTDKVAGGNLTVRVKEVHGAEVSKLGASLNSMIEKIQQLLHTVEVEQTNLREAELELLQAQINPHFLYNTLDTIIWLTESGKAQDVVGIVRSLSDFFRTSLNHGNGMFTLSEEERHVRSYMEIQQVRYQDILDYEVNIPEELKDAVIPKITLQPLVENALYHGIKNRRGKGLISIGAYREEKDVVIFVKDNGIGMTESQLEEVRGRIRHRPDYSSHGSRHESYGLYNVNERIKLKFGPGYGLAFSSVHGEGTCVYVRIPFGE